MKRTLCLFLALILAVGICFSAPVTITASANFYLEIGTDHTVGAIYIDSITGLKFKITDIENKYVEVCGCYGSPESIIIPETVEIPVDDDTSISYAVTAIGEDAFSSCKSITSLTIPNSVTTIVENSLRGISINATVYVPCKWRVTPLYNFALMFGVKVIMDDHEYNKNGVCENCGYECPSHTYEFAICKECAYICQHETITDGVCVACGGKLCGKTETDRVVWFYDEETTTLTISGEGEMASFYEDAKPWYNYIEKITKIDINKGVTSIGEFVFSMCTKLVSVTIPESVTTIGDYAFQGCRELTEIVIPGSVTQIGTNAFKACHELTTVNVPCSWNENPLYTFEDGVAVNIERHTIENNNCTVCKGSKCGKTESDTVTWVYNEGTLYITGKGAMADFIATSAPWKSYQSKITTVVIGSGVTAIGNYAFCDCTALTLVTIPESVTTIGHSAFNNCTALASVTIPDSVKTIGEFGFDSCESLISVTIPDSVTTIGGYAFAGCSELKTVTIGEGLTTFGDTAFYYCKALKSIEVDENNAYYSSVDGVLFNKDKTELIYYPLGKDATSYTIPDSVKKIEKQSFFNCQNLESVTIQYGVEIIGLEAFFGCKKLASVTIPDSVKEIHDYAFENCTELTSVTIGEGITTIGSGAFDGCVALTTVKVPCSWAETPKYTKFANSVTVDIQKHNYELGVCTACKYDCTHVNQDGNGICTDCYFAEGTCGENVTWIYDSKRTTLTISGSGAMADYDKFDDMPWNNYQNNIIEVVIENGVTTIGEFAFDKCTLLEAVTIGEAVTTIGDYAFAYCSFLKSVTMGDSVTSIGDSAFAECAGLTSVTIPDSVTTISGLAFDNCSNLTSVTIPKNVTTIGRYAFAGCAKLISINVDGANTTYSSVDGVLFNKDKTELIYYPLGKDATSYTIPESVTTIDEGAFKDCTALTSVTIGEGITTIGSGAFNGCNNLSIVNVPCNWDTEKPLYAFDENVNIKVAPHSEEKTYDDNGNGTHTEKYSCCGTVIGEPEEHNFDESGYCEYCEYQCPHEKYSNGVCDVCGCYCSHTNTEPVYKSYEDNTNQHCKYYECCGVDEFAGYHNDENGDTKCDQCEVQLVAKAYLIPWTSQGVRMGINYFVSLENAVDKVNEIDGEELILLSDATIAEDKTITLESAILNTNGNKLTVNGTLIISAEKYTGVTIPDGVIGSGTVKIGGNFFKFANNGKWSCAEENQHTSSVQTCVGYLCELCGNYYGEANDEHEIVTDNAQTPTCTKTGLTEGEHCTRCDYKIAQEVVPTLEHKDTLVKVDAQAPTCTEIGYDAYEYCTACTYTTYKEKAALNHNIVIDKAVAPTCTKTGLTEGSHCSRCNGATVKQEIVAAKGHTTSVINAKAATCTVDGYSGDTYCSTCKSTTVKGSVIKATGHKISVINAKSATCTADGYSGDTYCSTCKSTVIKGSVIKATGHKLTLVGATPATFKADGYTGDEVCSVCNQTLKNGAVIKKLTLTTPAVTAKNSAKGITISWNAIENAESYIVYRRVYDALTKKWSAWSKLKTDYTSTSFEDTTVTLGTQYRYTVRAVNGDVISKYESTATIKYNVTPTVKVSNTANGVKVTWSTAANATGYRVYRSTLSNGKWSGWKNMGTAKANKTAWTDKTVKTGVTYKYTVRAVYNNTLSSYNKTGTAVLFLATPTVKIANASNGIKVSWSKVNGATGYVVYSSQYDAATQKWSGWSNRGTVNTNNWVDTAVKSGVQYKYTVRATNGKTLSAYKGTSGLMFLTQPTVKIANVAKGIKVTWSMCDGATGYTVYRSEYDAKTKKWSKWKSRGTAAATKSSWTDKKVTSGKYYKYTVRAVNGNVKSTYVSSAKLYYLLTPTVTATAVQNEIKVSWTQSAGAKGYTVYSSQYDPVTNKWSNWSNRGTAKADQSSWVDKKAQAGVKYRYTVRAVNNKAKSAYTASNEVTK